MKKLIAFMVIAGTLATSAEVFAKNDKDKGGDRGGGRSSDRGNGGGSGGSKGGSERDSDRGSRSGKEDKQEREYKEREEAVKNEKAVDAQKNWGKLKDDPEYADMSDKEAKEEIKAEKRVRREIKSDDIDWDRLKKYDGSDEDIERLIDDFINGDVSWRTKRRLKKAGMSEKTLDDIEKAVNKYEAALHRIDDGDYEYDDDYEDYEDYKDYEDIEDYEDQDEVYQETSKEDTSGDIG